MVPYSGSSPKKCWIIACKTHLSTSSGFQSKS